LWAKTSFVRCTPGTSSDAGHDHASVPAADSTHSAAMATPRWDPRTDLSELGSRRARALADEGFRGLRPGNRGDPGSSGVGPPRVVTDRRADDAHYGGRTGKSRPLHLEDRVERGARHSVGCGWIPDGLRPGL